MLLHQVIITNDTYHRLILNHVQMNIIYLRVWNTDGITNGWISLQKLKWIKRFNLIDGGFCFAFFGWNFGRDYNL